KSRTFKKSRKYPPSFSSCLTRSWSSNVLSSVVVICACSSRLWNGHVSSGPCVFLRRACAYSNRVLPWRHGNLSQDFAPNLERCTTLSACVVRSRFHNLQRLTTAHLVSS